MSNILEEVQAFVADKLNADPQLSACPFLIENRKDIDFEIKNALGKQGIVGLVMTPKATFAGAFQDVGLAWQLDELEVSIVESVTVNRGKKDGYVTGQDASMRLFDVLCPLSGEGEGQFSPVSYEEGEDGSLLVNKCILKCLVHPEDPNAYTYIYGLADEPKKVMWRGEVTRQMVEDAGLLSADTDFAVKFGLAAKSIGLQAFEGCQHLIEIESFGSISAIDGSGFSNTGLITPIVLPQLETIRDNTFTDCPALQGVEMQEGLDWIQAQAFSGCSSITELVIPASVTKVGYNAFAHMDSLQGIYFLGKTQAQLHDLKTWGIDNYPWGIEDTQNIHSIIGPNTRVKYGWSQSWDSLPLSGTLNSNDLPSRDGIRYIGIGSSIDEIGYRAFSGMEFLTGVEIPTTVTAIGAQAFSGAEGMTDIEIPSSVLSIGSDAFFGCHILSSVMFEGKTLEQVQSMANYPWGLYDPSIIHAEL